MGIRRSISGGLRRAGFEVHRTPPSLIRSQQHLMVDLEHVLARLAILDPRTRQVLQIGAFDGVDNDPLIRILGALDWPAVLVEPQPAAFDALSSRYAGVDRVQTFEVAIDAEDGERTLYTLEPVAGMPTWGLQVASFQRDHLQKSQRYMAPLGYSPRIVETVVQTWTFDRLLAEAAIDHVDVLHIDVEGYDWECSDCSMPPGVDRRSSNTSTSTCRSVTGKRQ